MTTRALLAAILVGHAASSLHADGFATMTGMAIANTNGSNPSGGLKQPLKMMEGNYQVAGNGAPPLNGPLKMMEGNWNVLSPAAKPPMKLKMMEGNWSILKPNNTPPGNPSPSPPPNNPPSQPPQTPWPNYPPGGGSGWPSPPQNPLPPTGPSWGGSSWTAPAARVPSNQIPRLAKYRLLVINPAENEGDVNFVIRGRNYALPAGMQQEIKVTGQDTIRFDRGTGETARYRARPGTYVFKVEDNGWEVYRRTISVTLDNTNEFPFSFLADGKTERLPAGESMTLKTQYPLQIEFDPGDSKKSVTYTLYTGNYRVWLNDTEDGIEIFDVDADNNGQPTAAQVALKD